MVHLHDQCSHLLLLQSCAAPGRQSAAAGARAAGHSCYIQTREQSTMEAVDVEAKADEVPEEMEKRSSMKGA